MPTPPIDDKDFESLLSPHSVEKEKSQKEEVKAFERYVESEDDEDVEDQ